MQTTVSGNEVMSINASGNVTILGDMTGTGDTKFLATGDIGIGPRQGTATSGAVYIGGNTDNPFVSPTAIFTGDGKVGIAQTDPKEKLNVAGAGLFEGDHATAVNAMGSTAGIMLHASSPNVFVSATSNGSDNRNMQLRALNAGSSNANQIFLEYTGNVGIGTGTPGTSRLYVSANSDGAFAQYILQDHSGGYGMGVRSDSGAMIYFLYRWNVSGAYLLQRRRDDLRTR